jgi:hypothetical protein
VRGRPHAARHPNEIVSLWFDRSFAKAGDERAEWKFRLEQTQVQIREFAVSNQELLPNASERGWRLQEDIGRLREDHAGDKINQGEIDYTIRQLGAFEASLEDDLARLPTYIVGRIGAYSSDQLITAADNVFSAELKSDLPPKVLDDFRAAGACLAFDLSTACGFHAFRAADAMIRAYYLHFVIAPQPTKEPRDWGGYIRAFRDVLKDQFAHRKPNIRTIELLDSIRATD